MDLVLDFVVTGVSLSTRLSSSREVLTSEEDCLGISGNLAVSAVFVASSSVDRFLDRLIFCWNWHIVGLFTVRPLLCSAQITVAGTKPASYFGSKYLLWGSALFADDRSLTLISVLKSY